MEQLAMFKRSIFETTMTCSNSYTPAQEIAYDWKVLLRNIFPEHKYIIQHLDGESDSVRVILAVPKYLRRKGHLRKAPAKPAANPPPSSSHHMQGGRTTVRTRAATKALALLEESSSTTETSSPPSSSSSPPPSEPEEEPEPEPATGPIGDILLVIDCRSAASFTGMIPMPSTTAEGSGGAEIKELEGYITSHRGRTQHTLWAATANGNEVQF
jgi:hypothetical protein